MNVCSASTEYASTHLFYMDFRDDPTQDVVISRGYKFRDFYIVAWQAFQEMRFTAVFPDMSTRWHAASAERSSGIFNGADPGAWSIESSYKGGSYIGSAV